MKKTKFLWIRDLPPKCRDADVRLLFERYGTVQKVRLFKEGHNRQAIVSFLDINAAVQASKDNLKYKDTPLKVEYCDSFEISGINFKKCGTDYSESSEPSFSKDKLLHGDPRRRQQSLTEQNNRALQFLHTNGRPSSNFSLNHNQVLRPVQSSLLSTRFPATYRSVKLKNLPPLAKLSDAKLRQGLFKELRHFGQIQSVDLPSTNSIVGSGDFVRVAIVTFRRPREAECACSAIQSGEKILFSDSVTAEPHPGFDNTIDSTSRSPLQANRIPLTLSLPNTTISRAMPTNVAAKIRSSVYAPLNSSRPPVATVTSTRNTSIKFPTRTLHVAGLTAGPTGPVTVEQLTTAFRKFGDILDVKLESSTTSALIQFTEVRSPIRAMSAHSRDPLRLGGRPLSLIYVPSKPVSDLWLSDLPPALANLTGDDLLHEFSSIVPVLELVLIHRTDPKSQLPAVQTSSAVTAHSPGHFVTYVQTSCTEDAMRLLTELRSSKYLTDDSSCVDETLQDGQTITFKRGLSRRPFGVDYASARQMILITNLKKNAKSRSGCNRIQIITAKQVIRDRSPLSAQLTSKRHSPLRLLPVGDDSTGSTSVTQDNRKTLLNNTLSQVSKSGSQNMLRKANRGKSNHPRISTAVSTNSSFASVKTMDTVTASRDSSPSSLSTISNSSSECSSVSSGSSSVSSSSLSSASETRKSPTRNRLKSLSSLNKSPPCVNNASSHRSNAGEYTDDQRCSMSSVGGVSSDVSVNKSSVWSLNEAGNTNVSRQPLNVVTTITSTILSPDRRSATSSGGLSSPGGSSSTNITGFSCCLPRTPNINIDPVSTIVSLSGGHSSMPNQTTVNIPKAPSMHSTVVSTGEFRVSPIARLLPSSASSGVSSGGRSFSSTSSNGSCANSPLIGTPPLSSNLVSMSSKATAPVPIFRTSESKLSSSMAKARSTIVDQSTIKLKPESSQGLSIARSDHLISVTRSPLTTYHSPSRHMQATPLTMSIKLLSPGQQTALSSPSECHSGKYRIRNGQSNYHSSSHPTTPSAPSLSSSTMSSQRGRIRSVDEGSHCKVSLGTSVTQLDSSDWLCDGSPVYESMYDKIKRRTNKEAEERKQRQLEVIAAREKKRKQKKKVHSRASPQHDDLSCNSRYSFSSDQSTLTAKSHRGKPRRLRALNASPDDNDSIGESGKLTSSNERKRRALTKLDRNGTDPNNWNSSQRAHRSWLNDVRSTSGSIVHESPRSSHIKRSCNEKRCSSVSSMSGDDGCNSPPGTLTRLSLGMRFPVSATYHECVRPPKDVRSKWEPADVDNDSLSQVSTSSYSSMGDKSKSRAQDHPRTKHHKYLPPEYDQFDKATRSKKNNRVSQLSRYSDHTDCTDLSPSSVTSKSNSRVSQCRKSNGTDIEQNACMRHTSGKLSRHVDEANFDRVGSKRKYEERLNGSPHTSVGKKRRRQLSDVNKQDVTYKQTINSVFKRSCEQHCTPKSYFSDDATVLDSETDEIKCSDSVSYTTGTSDLNMSTFRISHDFERNAGVHSGTDDSSLPHTHSPSPVHNRELTQQSNFDRRHECIISTCEAESVHSEIKEHSSHGVLFELDRFSLDSKSTPSTEAMEEPDFNDHNYSIRFSDDDWDSSLAPESPQLTNVELAPEPEKMANLATYPFTPYFSTTSILSPSNSPNTSIAVSTDERLDEKRVINLNDDAASLREPDVVNGNSPTVTRTAIDVPSMEFESQLKEDPGQMEQKVKHSLCSPSDQDRSPCTKSNSLPKPLLEFDRLETLNLSARMDANISNAVKPTVVTVVPCISETSHLDIKPITLLEKSSVDCQSRSELLSSTTSGTVYFSDADSVHFTPVITSSISLTVSPSQYSIAEQDSPTVQTKNDIAIKRLDEQTTPLSDSMNASTTSFPSLTDDGEGKLQQIHDDVSSAHIACSTPSLKASSPFIEKTACSITDNLKTNVSHMLVDPPGVHDVERYVQSVIARVKAESVEQTQQAAVLTAQLPTSSQPTVSVFPVSASVSQLNKSMCDTSCSPQLSSPSTTCVSKRATGSQRRPLLISSSMCSSKKVTSNICSKWTLSPTATVLSSVCVNSIPYTRNSKELFTEATSNATICTVASVLSRPNNSDSNVPSIPGVNACAPLASLQTSSFPFGPVAVKQTQPTSVPAIVSNRLEFQTKDDALSPAKCLVANNSLSTNTRRRRKSEGKAVSSPYICMKDPVIVSQVSPSTSAPMSTSISELTHSSRRSGGNKVINPEIVQPSTHVLPQVSCLADQSNSITDHKSVPSTIDPYEPNFDEESSLNHSHLLHPPKAQSPSHSLSPQICSVINHPPNTPTATAKTITTVDTAVTSVCSAVYTSPMHYSGCDTRSSHASYSSIASTVPKSDISSNLCGTTCTDSVDEVIRDVCAGQFDVQSYLKSLRSYVGITGRAEIDGASSTTSTNISTIPQNSSSALSAPTNKLTNPASTLPSKPFPLTITSEPVVAAITIPISSSGATNKSNPNGSTNAVGVNTGAAVLINRLVAALQSIPGSQVTVTGPAAAAGLVGNVGNGAISATTITLPVGATDQAAANIRAVVFSATSTASSTNTDTTATANLGPEASRVTSTSGAPFLSSLSLRATAATSIVLNPSTGTTVPINTISNLSNTNPANVRSSPVTLSTVISSNRAVNSTHSSVSLYSTVVPTTKHTVDNSRKTVPIVTGPPTSTLLDIPGLYCKLSTTNEAVRQSIGEPIDRYPLLTSSSTINQPVSRSNIALTNPMPYGSPLLQHMTHAANSLKYTPVPLSAPAVVNVASSQTQLRTSNRTPSSASPFLTGRTPPLSTSPSPSNTLHHILDRFSNGCADPNALLTLLQATASNNVTSCRGESGSTIIDSDAQTLAYFRRLIDTHLNSESISKPVTQHNGFESRAKSLSARAAPSPSIPLQRVPLPVSSLTTSIFVNTTSPIVSSVSRIEHTTDSTTALISPPISAPRQCSTPTSSQLSATGTSAPTHAVGPTYPLVWQGRLSLKNAEARVALHYIQGNPSLLEACVTLLASGGGGLPQNSLVMNGGPLRIVQRMRLEPTQLEGVQRKIQQDGASCACLAIPVGTGHADLLHQTQILNESFIRYMQEKMAAGIINVGCPDFQQGLYVVHIFPPCDFSHAQLNIAAPELHRRVVQANQSHLLVVITTV